MKNIYEICLVLSMGLMSATILADDDDNERRICGSVNPLLSVADFNGNGIVDQDDIKLISMSVEKEVYYAIYDVNTDGKVDNVDIKIVKQQVGLTSQFVDQQLALLFNRVKQFQQIDNVSEVSAMGYFQIASSLAGHGEHWTDFVDPLEADYLRPEGLNISKIENTVSGVFWGVDAVPVFEGGAMDYPTPGGEWETQRVIAFADQMPKIFASEHEHWHTHASLCITFDQGANGLDIKLNQHTTFAQCQTLPSVVKTPETGQNIWSNIWMLHAWLFDLNPNGVFANTHPCLDPDSPSEDSINGGREVPPFFEHL